MENGKMFNKIIVVGNLTRDVELRYTASSSAIAKFGLAINRNWKDRNTGEKREEVCYVDVNIFGRSAEVANQHLAKGKKILVEGRLQFEQWQDQTGQKRSKHSISAESFQFLDSKGDNPPQQRQSPTIEQQVQAGEIDPSDIPF